MKLPPFEEFLKTIPIDDSDKQNDVNMTKIEKIALGVERNTQIMCLEYIKQYHNWLMEQIK